MGYWFRILNGKELKLISMHRQRLAIIWAVTRSWPYLKWASFQTLTDHEAVRRILTLAEATGKKAPWLIGLSELAFDIGHRAGIKHRVSGALTTINTKPDDYTPGYYEVIVLNIFAKSLACAPLTAEPELETV